MGAVSVVHPLQFGLYKALKRVALAVPHPTVRRVGGAIGRMAFPLVRKYRALALKNLALAMPALTPRDRVRIARQCFANFGATLLETISAARFTAADVRAQYAITGWEHLTEAVASGRGVFIVASHFGSFELVLHPLGLGLGGVDYVARSRDNPYIDRDLSAIRNRFGNRCIPSRGAALRALGSLRAGRVVCVVIDHRVRKANRILVPFFGHPAWTSPLVAQLSIRTGALAVPVCCEPMDEGRYGVTIRPPIEPIRNGEDAVVHLTRHYLADVEQDVARRPELWLWMHKRWKLA